MPEPVIGRCLSLSKAASDRSGTLNAVSPFGFDKLSQRYCGVFNHFLNIQKNLYDLTQCQSNKPAPPSI